MTREQAKIILSYARNNMSAREAGKELFMTAENVHYHLKKIRKQMGWNPKNFFDLCYLVGVAAQRIGGSNE